MDSNKTVLALSCSPREGGNTDLMADAALEGAVVAGAVVAKVRVPDLDINPCMACHACSRTGRCVQEDDMPDLLARMLSADGIVLAAPIFSMGLAAQAKVMIDRLQCCWATKYVLKRHMVPDEELREARRGLWLSAAGMKKPDIFEPSLPTVRYFFGMLEIKHRERVCYYNVDERGAILEVPGALDACREAGARLVNPPETEEGEREWLSSLS
ncbi:MAG: flavodoxin family protein [Actinomycetota bacterium]